MSLRERLAEAIKSLLIFLLFLLMLVLLLLLISGQARSSEEEIPYEQMVVYASEEHNSSGMDSTRVTPAVLAWRQEDSSTIRIRCADGALYDTYSILFPTLRVLFSDDAVCEMMDKDAGETLWAECVKGTHSAIYIRYTDALPVAVLRAYTYDKTKEADAAAFSEEQPLGDSAYVLELFLIEDDGLLRAVGRDNTGTVSVFQYGSNALPEEAADALDPDLLSVFSGYADTDSALDGQFLAVSGTLGDTQGEIPFYTADTEGCDTALCIPDGILSLPGYEIVTASIPSAEQLISCVAEFTEEEASHYEDAEGDTVYLTADGRFLCAEDGTFTYEALEERGLSISGFLGYSRIVGSYTALEILSAADNILSSITACSPACYGGDAVPLISGVSAESETMTITYRYAVDGILLSRGGEPCLCASITITDNRITAFKVYSCPIKVVNDSEAELLPQNLTLKLLYCIASSAEDIQTRCGAFTLTIDLTDADCQIVYPTWTFAVSAKEGGNVT